MKKGDKFIILLLLLVILLITATIGYRFLSNQYTPEEVPINITDNKDDTLLENKSDENMSFQHQAAYIKYPPKAELWDFRKSPPVFLSAR